MVFFSIFLESFIYPGIARGTCPKIFSRITSTITIQTVFQNSTRVVSNDFSWISPDIAPGICPSTAIGFHPEISLSFLKWFLLAFLQRFKQHFHWDFCRKFFWNSSKGSFRIFYRDSSRGSSREFLPEIVLGFYGNSCTNFPGMPSGILPMNVLVCWTLRILTDIPSRVLPVISLIIVTWAPAAFPLRLPQKLFFGSLSGVSSQTFFYWIDGEHGKDDGTKRKWEIMMKD